MFHRLLVASVAAAFALGGPVAAHDEGAHLPPGFELVPFLEAYKIPVGTVFTGDGRFFVLERDGRVFVRTNAQQQVQLFIDLVDEVNNNGDRGLLGLAVHPNWVPDGGPTSWVYLLYTVSPVPGVDLVHNGQQKYSFSRLTRYRAIEVGGEVVADLSSRHVLLGNQMPDGSVPDGIASLYSTHSNGSVLFANDGSLLFSTGDGAHADFLEFGGADDPGFDDWTHPLTGLLGPTPKVEDSGAFRSQDIRSLAGKIVRIDPETGLGYPSNPFFNGDPASHESRIWAYGFRNPFRMDFVPGSPTSTDPAAGMPGYFIVGDVGRGEWEELNVVTGPGQNFGWPCFEGIGLLPTAHSYERPEPNPYGWLDCSTSDLSMLRPPTVSFSHSLEAELSPSGIYAEEDGTPLDGFTGKSVIGGAYYFGGNYPVTLRGRYFFADYVEGWIKTARLDASGAVTALKPFAEDVGSICDISADPLTGDLYICTIGFDEPSRVWRLSYGSDLTPVAEASAVPTFGDAPLTVDFDGSESADPDGGALTYLWDFDDGSAPVPGVAPTHTFVQNGTYNVRLTVTDPSGLFAQHDTQISVGNAPPSATIATPAMGQQFTPGNSVLATGSGSDPDEPGVELTWIVDQHHGTHVHPGFFTATGSQAMLPLANHGAFVDTVFYRVRLRATDSGGLISEDHVFVYPEVNLADVSGKGELIARVNALAPPGPLGTGQLDLEVIRDGVYPELGSGGPQDQFDTFHAGDQGDDDWVGIELGVPVSESFRYIGLTFEEGLHFADGGWFEDLSVEVREDGDWRQVENLHISPPYPFAQSQLPFFDGAGFDTYSLDFDPVEGDAIRLRGTPGGSAGYISVAELRARAVEEAVPQGLMTDVTDAGSFVARVFELSPPSPTGSGSSDPETMRNGTCPPTGSNSLLAQFDTEHGGDQGTFDWIGYEFSEVQTFAEVTYVEGQDGATGGWFESLAVEVQASPGAPWIAVDNLTSSPAYPGTLGLSYETFVLSFMPALGTAIRISGDPGGSVGFVSASELRVSVLTRDCNQNGVPDSEDIALGDAPDLDGNLVPDECDPLSVDIDSISIASGGTQTFTLNLPSEAGRTYLLAGSVSGTTPGIPLGDTLVPLKFDFYVLKTIGQPNVAPLAGSLGVLDAGGQATAQFSLAPAPFSTLAGITAHHAFVTLDLATAQVYTASNAVPLSLLP